MTATVLPLAQNGIASVGDFFALLKPRVMSLVVFTGLAGMIVAPGHLDPFTAITALLSIAVGAGASGALNMAYDSDIDALMARTRSRPIPLGRIVRGDALAFGWSLAVGAVTVMALFVNPVAAALLACTILFYVLVYTLWLKRRTPQNIVIGGLAGALPPAIGWASVTGALALAPLLFVAIIFVWTPPHFWSLALWRSDDYARAGVPMMPVAKGKASTRRQIAAYAFILAPLGLLPAVIRSAGPIYLFTAAVLGGLVAFQSIRVLRDKDEREPAARRLFALSIVYLFALFATLILERSLGVVPLGGWA